MIEGIHLANEGAYDATGTKLEDLKKLNFIFGSNGSGKTTISRIIEGSGSFPDCRINWAGASPQEPRVYNKDFVEKHFDAESNIKGVYTFGENVEIAEKLKTLKGESDEIKSKLNGLQMNLTGEDGTSGKKKKRETLTTQFVEDVWDVKRKIDGLDEAFKGLNSNKKRFCDRYLTEAPSNVAIVRNISELREDAATVYSDSLIKATILPDQDSSNVSTMENSAILKKIIIGKEDVDIAELIAKVGNSDWVQQGQQYFGQLEEQCPFCQQATDVGFKQSLKAYFDERYIADIAAIDKMLEVYTNASKNLLAAYRATDIVESPYLNRETFERNFVTLRLTLDSNSELITAKRIQLSAPAILSDTAPLFAAVSAHIGAANKKIKANNEIFDNLVARKREQTSQVWKWLLEDTKVIYDKFKLETGGLDKAITSLGSQIEKETRNLEAKREKIEEYERKITSIKPTIDVINKLLKSFGFTNFHLVEGEASGFYEVKRSDGSDAKRTLSEGEKSFITFLYFYYLVRGSFSSSGATNDKVVVFDDPVSSLDADILFIVCNLIKNTIAEMRTGTSPIKQVFVLTHNIYFHKEVTFDKKRNGTAARSDETFWVVRKTSQRS